MNLILLKENLKVGLGAAERAVAENNNLPILKNILLSASGKKIKLSATNLEIGVTHHLPGKINEEGAAAIPFGVFYSIVSHSDSERIHLETEKNTLLVSTEHYHAKLQGMNSEEFPIIPRAQQQQFSLEVSSEVFKRAVGEVISAAQISEIRPEISGILFDLQPPTLKLVATDSFRLAAKTLFANQFNSTFPRGQKVIIPLKTMQEVMRIFSDAATLTIHLDPNQISFETEETELISRLIDGQYPDYEQIIPKANAAELLIDKGRFESAIKLASSFSGKTNEVRLAFQEDKNVVELSSANQHVGEGVYHIPTKAQGERVAAVGFNARYLADGLKPILAEQFVLGVNGDARPTVIRAPEDVSYFYLIMPVKNV